ncbi:hypothetical protein D9M70_553280 [compost metagenome]
MVNPSFGLVGEPPEEGLNGIAVESSGLTQARLGAVKSACFRKKASEIGPCRCSVGKCRDPLLDARNL